MRPIYPLLAAWLAVASNTSCAAKKVVRTTGSDCNPAEIHSKIELWSNTTCLRGANVWQRRINRVQDGDSLGTEKAGPPYLQSDFDKLKTLGANWVNLSVPGIFSETVPYTLDSDMLQNLDLLVQRALKADLFVVISFRTGPGRNEKAIIDSENGSHKVWSDTSAQRYWVEMWKTTADYFKNFSHVVGYNLMVEPNSNIAIHSIEDPKTFYSQHRDSLSDWNPLFQRIITGIRSIDSNTPIIVEPMNFASLEWLDALARPNDRGLVFAVHFYEPYAYTHQYPPLKLKYQAVSDWTGNGKLEPLDRVWIEKQLKQVSQFRESYAIPVVMNEWGAMRYEPGAKGYFSDTFQILESLQISHSLWLWESSYSGIQYDQFNFRNGTRFSSHSESMPNALSDVIRANWGKNRVRPSNLGALHTGSPK